MQAFHYQGCGLPNVYLLNGYKKSQTPYGATITVQNVEGLHGAIADQLVPKGQALTPAEFRFLRVWLDMSQKSLGELLGVSDQTTANWEKGHTEIPKSAETLLRMLVREHRGGDIHVRQFVERVNQQHRHGQISTLTFKQTAKTWKVDRRAA